MRPPQRRNRGKARAPPAPYRRRTTREATPHPPADSPQTSMDSPPGPSTPSLEDRISHLEQQMDGATARLEAATKQLGDAAKALEAAANLQLQASERPGPSQLPTLQAAVEELNSGTLPSSPQFSRISELTLPTDASIDQSVCSKILEDKFVEFRTLLRSDTHNNKKRLEIAEVDGVSSIVMQNVEDKRRLTFTQWCTAFNIFRTIRQRGQEPGISEALGEHFQIVSKLQSKNQDWEQYDRKIREMISANKYQWGVFNMVVAWDAASPAVSTNSRLEGGKNRNSRVCFAYNSGFCRFGEKCRFQHRCSACNGYNHMKSKCFKNKNTNNNNNQAFTSFGSQAFQHNKGTNQSFLRNKTRTQNSNTN